MREKPDHSTTSVLRCKADSGELFLSVYDPLTRTVYANGIPSTAAGAGMLLDAVLHADRALNDNPSLSPVDEEDIL